MSKRKINIITLGCAKNIVDSEHLASQCEGSGFEIIFDSNDPSAKIIVINTCGFILDAKQESIDMILGYAEAKRRGDIDHLFVFGCLSERYKEELKDDIQEVDEFFGVYDMEQIIAAVGASYQKERDTERKLTTPSHYAYLKISEGCNWGCGYCAIPLFKGRHKSVPMEELLLEATKLAANGVKELLVVAQDTTYYGMDLYGKRELGELLRRLCRIEGIEWVRLHYAYPAQFPQEVIEVMATEPKMCRYIDIPFQHISDNMLSSMRRGLGGKGTRELVNTLRQRVQGITIRTTMITGYPGETIEDFEELCEYVREAKFERLGVFPYSPEEGTYSYEQLVDDVPDEEKERRRDVIMEIQRDISAAHSASLVGKKMDVMIDSYSDGLYVGRTQGDSPEVDPEVYVTSDEDLEIGGIYEVLITSSDDYDLHGVC